MSTLPEIHPISPNTYSKAAVRFLKYSLWLTAILLFFVVLLELALRKLIHFDPGYANAPRNYFLPDSILGWKNKKGHWEVENNNQRKIFSATVNPSGNRISSFYDTLPLNHDLPQIHVYGCSFTFGFSVVDSAAACFQLQKKMPGYKVVNKGVPAYGLGQMFLYLQQTVQQGDTPQIAIFNYSEFRDNRTPFDKQWASAIAWSIDHSGTNDYENLTYPYYTYKSNQLNQERFPFNKLQRSWPLIDKSSVIFFAEIFSFSKDEANEFIANHKTSKAIAIALMRYCTAHHIIPVFAKIEVTHDEIPTTTDISDTLSKLGYYTLDYGIDINRNQYNCQPIDGGHPNTLAHSIFAEKQYSFIKKHHLF